MEAIPTRQLTVRALHRGDLDAVVALDATIERRSRREYFARRLAAALREPSRHVQLAADDRHGLAGYVLACVLDGEFGRTHPSLRLEAIGARADAKGAGVGARLFGALTEWGRRHGAGEIRTQSAWNRHAMLRWLDEMGFALGQGVVVDRAVAQAELESRDDAEEPGPEIDYGAQRPNDYERARRDRADIATVEPRDLGDIVRIDRACTGRVRESYIRSKLEETLADSAIRVSLVARLDGIVAGFLMARTDLGDFGRVEPVAVIDTIGVDPAFSRRGVGGALLSQLMLNLGALRIERVETVVAPGDLTLHRFLYASGFAPSQRLAFVRDIATAGA